MSCHIIKVSFLQCAAANWQRSAFRLEQIISYTRIVSLAWRAGEITCGAHAMLLQFCHLSLTPHEQNEHIHTFFKQRLDPQQHFMIYTIACNVKQM